MYFQALKNLMKKLILLFCVLTSLAACAQDDAAYIKANYTKHEYQIPMRDGKKLFTSVYVPKDQSKKYPFMMDRTCYSVAPYGTESYKTSLGPSPQFLHDGYIFVYQDVRGRWMSEGIYEEMTPELEVHKTNKDVDEGTDTCFSEVCSTGTHDVVWLLLY
jgi:predicted acyl esterase